MKSRTDLVTLLLVNEGGSLKRCLTDLCDVLKRQGILQLLQGGFLFFLSLNEKYEEEMRR